MSKKNTILILLILISFASICVFSNSQTEPMNTSAKKNSLIDSSTPKESGYKITSMWNYSKGVNDVNTVAISKTGNYIVAGINQNVTLFDKSSNTTLWNVNLSNTVNFVSISMYGNHIAVGDSDGNITVFDNIPSTKKKPIWSFNTSGFINSVKISNDGEYIAVASHNPANNEGSVWLFNTSYYKGAEMWCYNIQNQYALDVDISYNGEYIGAGFEHGRGADNICFFNKSDYKNIPMWSYEMDLDVEKVSMSYDGSYIVVSNGSGSLYLFNTSIEPSALPKIPEWDYDISDQIIVDLEISSDSNCIVTGTNSLKGGSAIFFFNRSSDSKHLPKIPEWEYGTTGFITSVAISFNGDYVLVGYDNGLIALFNRTAKDLKLPEWEKQADTPVNNVALSKEARYFAVGAHYDLHLFHHDVPLPIIYRILFSGDDEETDDEEIAAVPLGDYYLIFMAIGVISLIVIMKRKVNFSKK